VSTRAETTSRWRFRAHVYVAGARAGSDGRLMALRRTAWAGLAILFLALGMLGRGMSVTMRRWVLDQLDQRLNRRLMAGLGSLVLSARSRSPCAVRYDRGHWLHRYRDGTVVRTRVGGPSPKIRDSYARDVFLFDYEPRTGDTIIDLGAGLGGEVCLFSRLVGESGLVVSIEAHPRTFEGLQQTIELNGLTNVVPVQCAVVGEPGRVFIGDDPVDHILNGLTENPVGAVAVTGRRLDEIVRSLGVTRVDMLKINIEGAELAVLESSRDVLATVDNLAVSCHDFLADGPGPDWRRTFDRVTELLTSAGYRVRTRPSDSRPWIRYYVYASRRSG
jgi:FkbM family methyltransferase